MKITKTKIDPKHLARVFAFAHSSCPVEIVKGNVKPTIEGDSAHCVSPSGKLINYPNAYKWKKIYVSSTQKVVVGRKWLQLNGGYYKTKTADGSTCYIKKNAAYKRFGFTIYSAIFKGRKGFVGTSPDKHEYHVDIVRTPKKAFKEAFKAFRKRCEFLGEMSNKYTGIMLKREDSIRAGNCIPMTDSFIRNHKLNPEKEYPAFEILKLRNDSFVLRACEAARRRQSPESLTI